MNKIVYFEGLPGAGKTTVIKQLLSYFKNNACNIDELPIPEDQYENIDNNNQLMFLKNDEQKYKKAIHYKPVYKYCFVDRGHISTVMFNLAKLVVQKDIKSIQVLQWYFSKIKAKNMFPDIYIYIDISWQTSFERKPRNLNDPQNMWGIKEAIQFIHENYVNFIKMNEPQVPVIEVQNSSTLDNLTNILISKLKHENQYRNHLFKS